MMHLNDPAAAMSDFLRKRARTPLREYFLAAGATCDVSTNCAAILEAARDTFVPISRPARRADFRLRFWVDGELTAGPPWPKPYVRGLGDLFFVGLDQQNSILIDRRGSRAIGRFCPSMGADQQHWKAVILPTLVTVLGPTAGVTGLHCGCVARGGLGLVLAGRSASGKSTLTMALAREGFDFLSDDWTYFSQRDNRLSAWGLAPRLKLLPDAINHFPELKNFDVGISLNGEQAYEVDPEVQLGFRRSRSCDPCALIFLERQFSVGFALTEISAERASERLQQGMLAETAEILRQQLVTIESLARRGSWLLQYGGEPRTVARQLAGFLV
ncbi:MAG: hypothetical protein ACRD2B_07220 [Terriglobia bacterium]